jgi:hypothetical protein
MGQDTRDLRVCYDADVEAQLTDTIDSVYDFLRLVQIATRRIDSQLRVESQG